METAIAREDRIEEGKKVRTEGRCRGRSNEEEQERSKKKQGKGEEKLGKKDGAGRVT